MQQLKPVKVRISHDVYSCPVEIKQFYIFRCIGWLLMAVEVKTEGECESVKLFSDYLVVH